MPTLLPNASFQSVPFRQHFLAIVISSDNSITVTIVDILTTSFRLNFTGWAYTSICFEAASQDNLVCTIIITGYKIAPTKLTIVRPSLNVSRPGANDIPSWHITQITRRRQLDTDNQTQTTRRGQFRRRQIDADN